MDTGNSKLDALNRLLIARSGVVPFDVVFLIGSVRDIDKAINMEKDIVGQYIKENILSEIPGVYLTDLKNAKSILEEHKFKSMNIDVSGLAPSFDYESFINDLGFENLDNDKLDEMISDDLREQILLDRETIVMETLLYHFEHHDDNVLHPDDFDWFYMNDKPAAKPEPAVDPVQIRPRPQMQPLMPESAPVKEESKLAPAPVPEPVPIKEAAKPELKEVKETSVVAKEPEAEVKKEPDQVKPAEPEEKKPVHGAKSSLFAHYKNAPVKQEMKVNEEQPEDEDAPLKPEEEAPKKKPTYITKDKLTDEEAAKNEELLNNLREKYKAGIKFIEDTCNSQYRIILNKMQDALAKNVYKTQFCPLYLEISDDRRTQLYHILYDIDIATIAFQKEVVHQVIHMGCAFCGHNWDEEITFHTKGPHFVSCPSCFSERPFEKE